MRDTNYHQIPFSLLFALEKLILSYHRLYSCLTSVPYDPCCHLLICCIVGRVSKTTRILSKIKRPRKKRNASKKEYMG